MARKKSKRRTPAGPPVSAGTQSARVEPAWLVCAICLAIGLAVWLVFGQTVHFGFVNYDDNVYVYDNTVIQAGLTPANIGWAFSHAVASNWHPLTVLSHMLDCQLYGLHAGGHHLTNVLLHAATAILLFLALREITRATGPSAFATILFAIHPLRAESVAWISERKDVLSGLFFVLTLWAYARYARRAFSFKRYAWVLVWFALGLMSKPMLVSVPFVLLLLDYWPLGRFRPTDMDASRQPVLKRLFLEKVPLVLFSAAVGIVTLLVQSNAMPTAPAPFPSRLANAFVSYAIYLRQFFWPTGLAAFYPLPAAGHPLWSVAVSLLLVLGISFGAWRCRLRCPWLFIGWLWFLIMLLPVIGLVQVGGQAHADRYTYLPSIGLSLALAWAMADLGVSWKRRWIWLGTAGAAAIVALGWTARSQVACWRNGETLWRTTLARTGPNALAERSLADCLLRQGRYNEAISHYDQALKIAPDADALNNLGLTFLQRGQLDPAIYYFDQASKALPHDLDIAINREATLVLIAQTRTNVIASNRIQPEFAAALNDLGSSFMQKGQTAKAVSSFDKASRVQPDNPTILGNLGAALILSGNTKAALPPLRKAVELDPDSIGAACNLAWALATSPDATVRDGAKAVELARHAETLTHGREIRVLNILAAAYAEAGQFDAAVETAERALQLPAAQTNAAWTARLQAALASYRNHQPLREGSPAASTH